MTDTPAIEALRQRRDALVRERDSYANTVEEYDRRLALQVGRHQQAVAALADIDRAISALSYPDE